MEHYRDSLIVCPLCEGDACYKSPINQWKFSYFCFCCGYQTNDLQKVGEVDLEALEETLPELYKDLKRIDSEERIWYPSVINNPETGTAFMSLTPERKLAWCAIKVRPLTEEEKKQLSNKNINYKSDTSTLKYFGYDFVEALTYINFFN